VTGLAYLPNQYDHSRRPGLVEFHVASPASLVRDWNPAGAEATQALYGPHDWPTRGIEYVTTADPVMDPNHEGCCNLCAEQTPGTTEALGATECSIDGGTSGIMPPDGSLEGSLCDDNAAGNILVVNRG
jgi:hypothetical protein